MGFVYPNDFPILLSYIDTDCVLLSFAMFYWVLLGFAGFLLGFMLHSTGATINAHVSFLFLHIYWVLLGCTGFP